MNDFTDFEWIAIENALETLFESLAEDEDLDFSDVVESVVWTYDLDDRMEKELIMQYDGECSLKQ
tara:strand:+ start:85 stop:279 length:195 start_codon:yes stop_codon:yes gene_type:complete